MSIRANTLRTTTQTPAPAGSNQPLELSSKATDDGRSGLMTVGQLAQRTGLSHKAIRELEGRGLIYSRGRSESNYRLFDDEALGCVAAIGELRSLGLTLAEIDQLHAAYIEHPDQPIGPQLVRLLDRSRERILARIQAQEQTLTRIAAFQASNNNLVASEIDPAALDPRCPGRRAA